MRRHLEPLDGIRALAVLAVIFYHGGFSWSKGGYIGVDVFFVLSGFLITSLLIDEFDSTGNLRFGAFWARRAKRLLPALAMVLAAVLLFARYVASPDSYPGLTGDALATAGYFANWHQWLAGSNYFALGNLPSPLLHTWSLAIEEQFYLVWPLIVWAVLRLTRDLRALLATTLIGATGSALAMASFFDPHDVSRVYYGSDTRCQALLIGAAAATAMSIWGASGRTQRRGLAAVGTTSVTALALAFGFLDSGSSFTYQGGLTLVALATAALLVSVVASPISYPSRVLSVAPLTWIGTISYGLYLWHWPVFVVMTAQRTGLVGSPLFAARAACTVAIATLSYYAIERPIRRGNWRTWRLSAIIPAAGAVGLSAVVLISAPLGAEVGSAVAASSKPSLHLAKKPSAAASAAQLPPPARIMFVGDSMAETLANGFGQVQASYDSVVDNQGDPNCSLAEGEFQVEGYPPRQSAPPCDPGSGSPDYLTSWRAQLGVFDPQVSVFLARLDVMNRLYDGTWTHIGDEPFDTYLRQQMTSAVETLTSAGGRVVLLTSPYYDSGEQPSGQPWPEDDRARVDLYNAMLEQVAAQFAGSVFVIDLNKIADPGGLYQSSIDGVEVRYSDGVHWTYEGDWWLAPQIMPEIVNVARYDSLTAPRTAAQTAEAVRTRGPARIGVRRAASAARATQT